MQVRRFGFIENFPKMQVRRFVSFEQKKNLSSFGFLEIFEYFKNNC